MERNGRERAGELRRVGQLVRFGHHGRGGRLHRDGKAEIVVGAGANGRVKVYDPLTESVISGPLGSFRAFGSSYTGSVFVGTDDLAGDVDDDGTPDLVVGTGAGATARVKVFSGADGSVLYDFQPFGSSFTGGAGRTGLCGQ